MKKWVEPVKLLRTTGWNYELARRVSEETVRLVKKRIAHYEKHKDLYKLDKEQLIDLYVNLKEGIPQCLSPPGN